MIFPRTDIDLIKTRRKSQTRRPVNVLRLEPLKVQPCRYHVGGLYACQPGHAQKRILDITVFDVRLEALGEITRQDIRHEGFRFAEEFRTAWAAEHGVWDAPMLVWVISFAVGDLRDRFDRPRLLRATPGHTSADGDGVDEHQDYTTEVRAAMSGLADPGEGVDVATLERLTAEGHAGHARRNALELRRRYARSLANRLKEAERLGDADLIARVCVDLQRLEQQIRAA